jgi:hypothetical protein
MDLQSPTVGGNQAFKFIGKRGFHDVKGDCVTSTRVHSASSKAMSTVTAKPTSRSSLKSGRWRKAISCCSRTDSGRPRVKRAKAPVPLLSNARGYLAAHYPVPNCSCPKPRAFAKRHKLGLLKRTVCSASNPSLTAVFLCLVVWNRIKSGIADKT